MTTTNPSDACNPGCPRHTDAIKPFVGYCEDHGELLRWMLHQVDEGRLAAQRVLDFLAGSPMLWRGPHGEVYHDPPRLGYQAVG